MPVRVCCQGSVRSAVNQLATPLMRFNLIGWTFVPRIKRRLYISNPKTFEDLNHYNKAQYQQNAFSCHSNRKSNCPVSALETLFPPLFLTCAVTPASHACLGALSETGRLKIMLHLLFCGAAVFPGLFYSFSKVFKVTFKHWSDADVFSISERFAALTWKMPHLLFSFHRKTGPCRS